MAPVWITVMRAHANTNATPLPQPRERNAYSPPVSG